MRPFPLRRLSSLALAGVLALAACQSSSSDTDTPAPTGERTSVVVFYKISKTESWKVPDSLVWSAPGQSGFVLRSRITDSAGTVRSYLASLSLKTPLRDSTLNLRMHRFGVRLLQVDYRAMGAKDTLTAVPGSVRYDSMALALLRGMDSLKAPQPQTREGLLSLYGTWILASDARVKDFPANLPVGIAAPEVIQAALVAASKTGKPLAEQAKTWSLGVSTDSAQALILELLRSGKIVPKDSSSLFPPPPVRVVAPLAVGTGLRAGSTSVGLTGAFAWDEGLGLVVFQGAVTRDGKPDTNLVVYGLPVPKSTDREAKLDGAASLLAKASAPEGTYVLTITAQDGAQHKAISRDTFTVAAKLPDQPQAPRIRLLSPSDKSIVPFETAEVTTTWIASTPQGAVSTVTVDGAVAEKGNDSTWQAKVRLEPTGKARTIVAKATNSAGLEAVATLELTRQADTARPALTWVAGGRSVGYDSAEVAVSVKASDNDSLASVTIGGLVATGGEGVFTARLKLEVGDNPVQVVAMDRTGNKDTLRATAHRYQKLSITRVSPSTPDTTVGAGIGSVALSWKVAGAKAVGVGDSVLTASGGLYTWNANLQGSTARVVFWATDSAGKRDTIEVAIALKRAKDTVKPDLQRAANTKDTVLQSNKAVITVSWNVSDEHLQKVTIDGATVIGTDGDFTTSVSLASASKWITIEASDSTGNISRDSILVRCVFPPAISPKSGGYAITVLASLTTVGSGTLEYALGAPSGWKVYGGSALSITSNAKLYARTLLDGVTSEIVEADYAFAPVLALAKTPDSGAATADVMVTATGAFDDIEYATDTSSATANWATLVGGSIPVSTAKVFARSIVGASKSPIISLSVHLYPKRPVVWPATGGYGSPQFVLLPETPATATIQYSKLDDKTTWFSYPRGLLIPIPVSGTLYLRAISSTGDVTEISANYQISTGAWNADAKYDTVRDQREGRMYRSIKIGTQTWMAENLAYDTLAGTGSWCQDELPSACTYYGRLYSWQTAMAGAPSSDLAPSGKRGICPEGWHLPSDGEWTLLSSLLGGSPTSGQKLKSKNGWSGTTQTNDSIGFRALPGAFRYTAGNYGTAGNNASWWTTNAESSTMAWKWYINYDATSFDSDYDAKGVGLSVRCLKD